MARTRSRTLSSRGNDRPMFFGYHDPITTNNINQLVNNISTLSRERFSRANQSDRRRDYDNEFGYPKQSLTAEYYHDLIKFNPMAAIVNSIYAMESWQRAFELYEEEDSETNTELEDAWDELPSLLGLEPSYYEEDKGNALLPMFLSADILAGECRFGTILLDFDDGKSWQEPVTPRQGMRLKGIRAFPESMSKITVFQSDPTKPLYRMPMQYMVNLVDPRGLEEGEIQEPNNTEYVHWSRIVHITDTWHTAPNAASSFQITATPRCGGGLLAPILDFDKVRGASAEGYYQACVNLLHFGTHPSLGGDVDVDAEGMKDMYEEVLNGLQRAMFTSGMDVKSLAPAGVSPKEFLLSQAQTIAMKLRIPVRKLIGNETGERSTTDDEKSLNDNVESRRQRHNTAKIIVPFVNRLINLGVLPKPKNGYKVAWPDITTPSALEKAQTLYQRTQSYALYTTSGMEATVPPMDYMTKFDDMTDEEAESIMENAQQAQEEMDNENQTLADEHGLVPEVDGFKEPTPDPIELEKAKASVRSDNG